MTGLDTPWQPPQFNNTAKNKMNEHRRIFATRIDENARQHERKTASSNYYRQQFQTTSLQSDILFPASMI
jgi:hypothetical protein